MAPTKTNQQLRVVGQGIDTLILTVYGELLPEVVAALEEGKRQAQEADDDWAPSPLPAFDGTTPQIHASGVKYHEWRCVSEDLTVILARPGRSSRPAGQLRVSAKTLARLGDGGFAAARLAWAYLAPLFAPEGFRVQLANVHVARDFQGWEPTAADLAGVVMRADGKDVYYGRGDRIESVAAGRSNRLRINLYDKRLQARKKAIGWVEAVWERAPGYDPAAGVWRSEFQYGREFLRDCGIDTLDQFHGALERLWAYGCGWFSFRVPGADAHRYRWTVLPAWAALSAWSELPAEPIARVKIVRPSTVRLAQGAAGYLTALMAKCGLAIDEVGVALDYIAAVVEERKGVGALHEAIVRKRQRYGEWTMAAA